MTGSVARLGASGFRLHSFHHHYPMSFLGGSRSNANTGAVNYEKVEMAVTECVLRPLWHPSSPHFAPQTRHSHRLLQPHGFVRFYRLKARTHSPNAYSPLARVTTSVLAPNSLPMVTSTKAKAFASTSVSPNTTLCRRRSARTSPHVGLLPLRLRGVEAPSGHCKPIAACARRRFHSSRTPSTATKSLRLVPRTIEWRQIDGRGGRWQVVLAHLIEKYDLIRVLQHT